MIDAKDLRIGDIVRILDDEGNLKPCKVVGVDMEICHNSKTRGFLKGAVHLRQFDLPDDEPSDSKWCEDIAPIPLTPEILEKNGWVWSDEHEELTSGTAPIAIYPESNYFIVDGLRLKLRYVQQLQHILWALGLDAEMEV